MPRNHALLLPLLLMPAISTATAQQCNEAIPPTVPDSRYKDNNNDDNSTVIDLWTGLMWQRCVLGLSGDDCATGTAATFTWDEALQQAEAINASGGFAGYNDWRLPNLKELYSLVENACLNPAINIRFFPNTPPLSHWSSSPYPNDEYGQYYTWFVDFAWGFSSYGGFRNNNGASHVRLVRGGR